MKFPTVKQLRYFTALVDKGHFGRAAESCFVSQSAFSTGIQEFESVLNTRLVDRTNRQVTITASGHKVAAQARRCLQEIEMLVETAMGDKAPLSGELRLGIIPTIAPFLLPKVLPKLRRSYPKLSLLLSEDQTQRLHTRLLDGDIDAIVLALPFNLRGTETLPLFRDPFLLACRDKTGLVDPDNYRLSRVEPGSVLLLEDGHCLRDHALDACKLSGSDKINRFSASSLLTLVEMVDADLGFTYLPEIAIQSGLLRNTKVRTHAIGERSFRTIGMAWRTGSARADEFRLLGEFLKNNR
jgi:LysR family hydrogen peroxide-inducible transcriptional activator